MRFENSVIVIVKDKTVYSIMNVPKDSTLL